jgi:hypothetical protein
MTIFQEKMLKDIAKENNLPYKTVLEIFRKACEKIVLEMSNHEVDERGIKNLDTYKTIHVQNFGKFIPEVKRIKASNHVILTKHERIRKDGEQMD